MNESDNFQPEEEAGLTPPDGAVPEVVDTPQEPVMNQQNIKETVPILENEKNVYADPNADQATVQTDQRAYDQAGSGYHTPNNYEYNTGNQTGYQKNYNEEEDTRPLSMGDWLLTLLALIIPCAGIILYFVWAFGKTGNINRRNFCRAYLIVAGISIILGFILLVVFGIAFAATGQYYYFN